MELIWTTLNALGPAFVSAGFLTMIFIWAGKLGVIARALTATFLGLAVTVGPGIFYNATEVGDSSPMQMIIYIAIYAIPCFAFTWFLSWSLNKKFSAPSEVFK